MKVLIIFDKYLFYTNPAIMFFYRYDICPHKVFPLK